MIHIELSNKIAIKIIDFILRKKTKAVNEEVKPITYETYNEYTGDVMDYDGMGNYSRFPCETK